MCSLYSLSHITFFSLSGNDDLSNISTSMRSVLMVMSPYFTA
jgi:hypothetical protein